MIVYKIPYRRARAWPSASREQRYLAYKISGYGFSDVFRLCRGNDRVYTHFNKQHKTSSRLDLFLIDDNLVNFPICSADVSHGYNSDHSLTSP